MGDSLGESRSTQPDEVAPLDLVGVVEPALAEALMLAARAGRWEVVRQIAGELEARRNARARRDQQVPGASRGADGGTKQSKP